MSMRNVLADANHAGVRRPVCKRNVRLDNSQKYQDIYDGCAFASA